MPQTTERTKLLTDVTKHYVFDSSIVRERKRRVKQFQCCLCVIFIFIFVAASVAIISYDMRNENTDDIDNSTEIPVDNLLVLLSHSWPLDDKLVQESNLNDTELENILDQSGNPVNEIDENSAILPLNSPSYKHQKAIVTTEKARILARIGYKEELLTRNLTINNRKICYNSNQSEFCKNLNISCDFRYRTFNGSCNNLKYPNHYGVAYRPFRRALPPDYADGISQPRTGNDGNRLPSARTVSLVVHPAYNRNNDKFTVVLAVWGQFLDHDITATALNQRSDGLPISCCNNNTKQHSECYPVELDRSDPFYIYNNISCMEFVRSAPSPTCCLGPREQMNQATAFIDGSVIYGIDDGKVNELRRFKNGQLDMYLTEDNRTLLPISKDSNDGCNRIEQNRKGRYCFVAGDSRSNENLHLTSMHLIWARHHNLLTENLNKVNPHWNDERLFQEARKILGAQMQHITYNEFLPILLGDRIMKKFDLHPKKSGYFTKYNNTIDPSIANNFATAAFRFAHSIIPGLMKYLSNDTESFEYIQLHRMLFDPFKLYQPGELDRALKGALDTTIQANDPYFTNELKQHLFEDHSINATKTCGLDLVSLNIQRGRDHGLVGYNSWREYCGLKKVHSFEQLSQDIDGDSLVNIQSIYRNVNDIDLYTGALSEKPLENSILGPTITCLILDQFIRLKYGDRYWYENPKIFTKQQLKELRKTTLAKIICNNSDNVNVIQPFVMEKAGPKNRIISCEKIDDINYDYWKDEFLRVSIATNDIKVRIDPN